MKLETGIRSKVGRRILILFLLCSLLPITVLAIISFWQVSLELNKQNHDRLLQASRESKAFGLMTIERIESLGFELSETASRFLETAYGTGNSWSEEYVARLTDHFESLVILHPDGRGENLLDAAMEPPVLSDADLDHLRDGRDLLLTRELEAGEVGVIIVQMVDAGDLESPVIAGRILTDYLWRTREEEDILAEDSELVIVDEHGNIIYSSFPVPPTFSSDDVEILNDLNFGQLELNHAGENYVASFWGGMPVKGKFRLASWAVVLCKQRGVVKSPMADFRYYFILVVLASIWVVFIASSILIRRNLVPLRLLKEGTRRIADQDFTSRVDVHSGDEFEELADSFNLMAAKLGQQFNVLSTTAEIDRAVLSLLDEERIIETVLNRTCDVLRCDGLTLTVFEPDSVQLPKSYSAFRASEEREIQQFEPLTEKDLHRLHTITEVEALPSDTERPPYVQLLRQKKLENILLLPIRLRDELAGVMALGYPHAALITDDEKQQARQLADRFTVALSNAHLVRDLDQLSWGTLVALARAIDAKSPWTAGHSERVTSLTLRIGQQLGMNEAELDKLHRGGLLHDLGKIGVPATILDKPGRLSDEDMEIMKGHPTLGARILEPIPAFSGVISIVLHHHERYDGGGYPDGLVGEEISVGARTLAVADFYDALTSERPYRGAVDQEKVIKMIEEESGGQFDPVIVEAFLEVVKSEEEIPTRELLVSPKYGG